MKNLRQLCLAVVLTLVVATHTFAGNMHTTVTDPPPPPPSSEDTEGQMPTGSSEAVDPVTQMALNLVQSMLSLF